MTGQRQRRGLPALCAAVSAAALAVGCAASAPTAMLRAPVTTVRVVALPAPDTHGTVPLEQAIHDRRSQRTFLSQPLPLAVIGQLLWAGQGVTDAQGRRAAPSAGGLYPLELYVVTVGGLLHYLPEGHRALVSEGPDLRRDLQSAALDQPAVGDAPAVIVIASVTGRTAAKYGHQATDFVNREAGHAAQNMLLEATALELSAVPIGGFNPSRAGLVLGLPADEDVLYLLPVGYPSS